GRSRVAEAMAAVRQRARRIQLGPAARYVAEFGNLHPAALEPLLARGAPLDVHRAERLFERIWAESSARSNVDRLLDLDSRTYLPDDIFVKVDIAAMACSLEVRSPMVDHHVLEYAASLSGALKLFGFRGKRVLRLAARELLPASILRRRKKGFTIPQSRWLRGDLRSMAHDTLLSPRCIGRGYFDGAALRRMLDEHDRGSHDHGLRLWNLLWLELWHRRFIDASSERAVAAA
ncbi:MAG: hypothetical protein KC503_27605, partial [Myxococcales bacterium]|nr:hypothetical protein [Myxococcales bacterium]